ncbi:MAG TPA: helix-turn-helix domain-containing protein [Kribbella sp.]|nr:helix-turn-helix domain-containing protein [Kribbella sp.]
MLKAIGLSADEDLVYVTLVDNPQSSAAQLARLCDLSSHATARVLGRLTRRGMATRLPGRPPRFVAVAPDVSIQPLLSRRENELQVARTAVHELTAAFLRASRNTFPHELVEVVTGPQNIINRALMLQDSAQAVIRGIVKLPYVMQGPEDANADRERRRLNEGVEYRAIYDQRAVEQPGKLEDIRGSVEDGEQARIAQDAALKVWIIDEAAALIPSRHATYGIDAAFVVYPCALLDALIALFELEWQRAIPFRRYVRSAAAARDDGLDDLGGVLLRLLAAGLTDAAIARSVGMSLRTTQRRIHELMNRLGATTRFQAGLAARERGLI